MGSRAKSTLFYGIHWDENEYVFKDEEKEFDDDFNDELQKEFKDLFFESIHCYETSYCLCIPETLHSGDWDGLIDIDLKKLKLIEDSKYVELFKKACERFGMNYKEPKLSIQSHYW